jgi:hypothetical protein
MESRSAISLVSCFTLYRRSAGWKRNLVWKSLMMVLIETADGPEKRHLRIDKPFGHNLLVYEIQV